MSRNTFGVVYDTTRPTEKKDSFDYYTAIKKLFEKYKKPIGWLLIVLAVISCLIALYIPSNHPLRINFFAMLTLVCFIFGLICLLAPKKLLDEYDGIIKTKEEK